MKEDIQVIENYMKVTDDEVACMALSKLRDVLVAWKKNKHIEKHTAFRKQMKGA